MAESTVIGVISPLLGGFYWSGVLSGIQAAAQRHGVQLIAIEGASLQLYRSRLAKDIVAGWILVMETAGAAHLLREGIPVVTRIDYLEGLVERNYAVSVTLLRSATTDAPKLGWLREAQASWGCLGLWEHFDSPEPALTISETYGEGGSRPARASPQGLSPRATRSASAARAS